MNKRGASFLLVLLYLLLSVLPTTAFAEENVDLEAFGFACINPLYTGAITEDDLVKPGQPLLYADNTGDGKYYDAKTAGEMIRDDLVARDTTIRVNISFPYNEDTVQQDAEKQIYAIMASAMAHTGNPVEGDYLLWQYTGFSVEFGNYTFSGQNLGATVTFTMTYHSSAEQEAEMDTAVSALLGQLNVSGEDDYTKLRAIYDYLTENITYDYDNLGNDSYKLKHTAYAALINKTAVCQGYSALLYRLALELGVDCRMIPGNSDGQAHVWNIAELNDRYYNLDSTWDAGLPIYQCFLVGSQNFTDHDRWDAPGQMPSDDNYNSAEFHAAYPMSETDYAGGCDHNYSAVITSPTCTGKGYTTYTCSACGDTYTGDEVAALGHNEVTEKGTAATCTAEGLTDGVHCDRCGTVLTRQETIPPLGHSWDEGVVTREPTEEETGIRTYTCKTCGETKTEAISTLEHVHNYTSAVMAPTCTEKGYTTYTCTCGDTYTGNEVAALGHNEVTDNGYAATCTEAGLTDGTHCDRCDVVLIGQEVLPATGHHFEDGNCSGCDAKSAFIKTQPKTGYARMGETVNVTVKAEGDGLTYQWYIKNAGGSRYSKSSLTSATYTANMSDKVKGRRVYCVITDQYGNSVQSKTVLLREAVSIVTEPKTGYGKLGETVKVSVEASGDELNYQWYIKNANGSKYSKSSVTGPAYSCKMSDKSKGRRVLCIITDAYGNSVQSKTVLLREAVSIVAEPKTGYAKLGKTVKVSVEASGDSLTYQWYIKNADGSKYSKSAVTSATYSCKMSDKTHGRRVYCVVTDQYGKTVRTKTVILRMAATITQQPENVSVEEGKTAKVTFEAVGDGLTYQWYIKDAGASKFSKASITKAAYSCTMSDRADGRQLYCVVTDQYGKTVKTDIVTLKMK